MLAETDLNRLERQLTDFNLATRARQDALDELTLTYGKLLEDYRTHFLRRMSRHWLSESAYSLHYLVLWK